MGTTQSFEDLDVWKQAHQLVLHIYRASSTFPNHEIFGLRSQLSRAVVSDPRTLPRDLADDRGMRSCDSTTSLDEARYQLILVRDLGYTDDRGILDEVAKVGRMFGGCVDGVARSRRGINIFFLLRFAYNTSTARG